MAKPYDPVANRRHFVKYKYGITIEQYEELLAKQKGGCAICGDIECHTGKSLAVDHDHRCCPGNRSCGKCVRGILCNHCNNGLGKFKDDPMLLLKAMEYLSTMSS